MDAHALFVGVQPSLQARGRSSASAARRCALFVSSSVFGHEIHTHWSFHSSFREFGIPFLNPVRLELFFQQPVRQRQSLIFDMHFDVSVDWCT